MKTPEKIKKGIKCPWCGKRMRFDADSVHCWFKCDNCLSASPKTRRVWDNAKGNKDNWDINKANARLLAQQLEAQVPRWISVEERLPEEHQDVLVWAVYHDEDGRDWALEEIDRYCETCGWDNTADAEAREVTHWTPKHKPPEEGAK